tara:strand:- start:429 stop:539 length:111 start_codon:yes stop_codon:yes gene_type:complete
LVGDDEDMEREVGIERDIEINRGFRRRRTSEADMRR